MEEFTRILDFWFASEGLWFKKDDAFDATVPGQNPCDRDFGANLATKVLRRLPQSVRDRSHASLLVPPGAHVPIAHIAYRVMEQNIGSSG